LILPAALLLATMLLATLAGVLLLLAGLLLLPALLTTLLATLILLGSLVLPVALVLLSHVCLLGCCPTESQSLVKSWIVSLSG
jgi:hypothetical protein